MFLCLVAGLLLARPCLADDDQLLEMSRGDLQTSDGQSGLNSAFLTDQERYAAVSAYILTKINHSLSRMWPNGKIPYTYHWTIEGVNRSHLVEKAIQRIVEASCLEFEDITPFMNNYMKNYRRERNLRDYFERRNPPSQYPDFLL